MNVFAQGPTNGAVDWSTIGFNVKCDGRLWTNKLVKDMWKMCQAPHNGKSIKAKHTLPDIEPCPYELFYCMARPILERGRTVTITTNDAGKKTGQVTTYKGDL